MDDPCRLGALHAVRIDMAHHIVTHLFFPRFRHIVIDVLCVRLQLVDLLLRDDRSAVLAQSKLHLCLGKRDPQLSPGAEFHIR